MDFLASEVLEGVLLNLPINDLLCMQRVCRRWRDLICQSPTLQQNLFFRPVSNKNSKPKLNPLLQALFPPCFKLTEPEHFNEYASLAHIQQKVWWQNVDYRNKIMRPEASWRRMFPVQPPAKIDQIMETSYCGCGVIEDEMHLIDEENIQSDGALMGLIFGILVQNSDDWGGSFHIRWHMFPITDKDISRQPWEDNEMSSKVTGLENKLTLDFFNLTDCWEIEAPSGLALDNPSRLQLIDFDIKRTRYLKYERE